MFVNLTPAKEHFVEKNACFDGDAPNSTFCRHVYFLQCQTYYKRIQNMFYEYGCCFHITVVLGWGQIDKHCWSNNVDRHKVEPFDIPSQQCENVCDQHDHTKFVFWFLSNISAQQICSSLLFYHFSTVIDFSSEKYSGSTGHRNSWYQ